MKNIETIDGNKLIAEFMGVPENNGWYDGWLLSKAGLPFALGAMGNGTHDLKFHSSWDWLMPVVEKVEKLGYDSHIEFTDYSVNSCSFLDCGASRLGDTKIEAVWLTVVDFIEWYNNQNK